MLMVPFQQPRPLSHPPVHIDGVDSKDSPGRATLAFCGNPGTIPFTGNTFQGLAKRGQTVIQNNIVT